MVSLLAGTDSTATSDSLADYLASVTTADDEVYVVNSLPGGDETTAEDVATGEDAIDRLVDRLDDQDVAVETHQFIRGNDPGEDLVAFADESDVDELVISVRQRTPVGKVVFGSTAQHVILNAGRPVRCVPLDGD